MKRTDEAAKVMQEMINRAIGKARDRGILGTSKLTEAWQGLLGEAFAEIPSSFQSRTELTSWHNKAIDSMIKRK